jgi:hypothetical protein
MTIRDTTRYVRDLDHGDLAIVSAGDNYVMT